MSFFNKMKYVFALYIFYMFISKSLAINACQGRNSSEGQGHYGNYQFTNSLAESVDIYFCDDVGNLISVITNFSGGSTQTFYQPTMTSGTLIIALKSGTPVFDINTTETNEKYLYIRGTSDGDFISQIFLYANINNQFTIRPTSINYCAGNFFNLDILLTNGFQIQFYAPHIGSKLVDIYTFDSYGSCIMVVTQLSSSDSSGITGRISFSSGYPIWAVLSNPNYIITEQFYIQNQLNYLTNKNDSFPAKVYVTETIESPETNDISHATINITSCYFIWYIYMFIFVLFCSP